MNDALESVEFRTTYQRVQKVGIKHTARLYEPLRVLARRETEPGTNQPRVGLYLQAYRGDQWVNVSDGVASKPDEVLHNEWAIENLILDQPDYLAFRDGYR